MLSLRRGSVTAVTERHEGLVRLEVDGRPCVAYPGMTGPVALGDDVLVNAQAVELGLGSGGFDVLYANLTRGLDLEGEPGAHVMKLPYTPLQYAVRHAEEDGAQLESLGGLPVVCCSLHSQVAPAAAGLGEGGGSRTSRFPAVRYLSPSRTRFARSVSAGSSRPLLPSAPASRATSLVSRPQRPSSGLPSRGSMRFSARSGPASWEPRARGGTADFPWRRRCSRPARSAGRRSSRSAIRKATRASAIAVFRITRRPCSRSPVRSRSAGPTGWRRRTASTRVTQVDVSGWQDACAGLPLFHMGRGAEDDPWFFAAAYAAGRVASGHVA